MGQLLYTRAATLHRRHALQNGSSMRNRASPAQGRGCDISVEPTGSQKRQSDCHRNPDQGEQGHIASRNPTQRQPIYFMDRLIDQVQTI